MNTLHLPSIKHDKSSLQYSVKKEFGDYFNIVNSLNTKYSLVLLYGCSLRCMEVQECTLTQDLEILTVEQLKVIYKGKVKDRYVPLSKHPFNSRTQNLHLRPKPKHYLFNGQPKGYSRR
jgi:site-specific recombinase XerC